MAEKDAPRDEDIPSLELPSLGFGRRKRKREREQQDAEQAPPAASPPPASPAPPGAEVEQAPEPVRVQEPEPRPEPEPVREPVEERAPAPVREPAARTVAQGQPLFEDERQTSAASAAASADPAPPPQTDADGDQEGGKRRREWRRPTLPTLPSLDALPAAAVAGLVVGLLTVGLVWLSQRGCDLVFGAPSCGRVGFLVLLAILVLAGIAGSAMLRALRVRDGGSTSFLGMGLVAVVLMLFLGGQLLAWWMALVVPVVSALAYAAAQTLTTVMVAPGGREMHR